MSRLKVRHMQFDYDQPFEPIFIRNKPEASHYFTGFSIVLHHLEPYMIRAMKQAMPLVTDDALRDNMEQFCRQEAQHFQQHKRFNDTMASKGFPDLKSLEEENRLVYKKLSETKSLKFHLAYAETFESLASAAIVHEIKNGLVDDTEGFVGDIWRWHFCEELEHRALAYDVYQHLYGDTAYRTVVGFYARAHFIKQGLRFGNYLLRADDQRIQKLYGGRWRQVVRICQVIREQAGLVPAILGTYKPGYSPHDIVITPRMEEMTRQYTEQAIKIR